MISTTLNASRYVLIYGLSLYICTCLWKRIRVWSQCNDMLIHLSCLCWLVKTADLSFRHKYNVKCKQQGNDGYQFYLFL